MLAAEIHNKLRDSNLDRSEDILTSNVFGVMQYLPPDKGLIPFIRKAINLSGQELGKDNGWGKVFEKVIESQHPPKYFFWPRMPDDSEPDVVILMRDSDKNKLAVLMIEAKYTSPKGKGASREGEGDSDSEIDTQTPGDQLAKYWGHLINGCADPCIPEGPATGDIPKALLYVTKHSTRPDKDLRESCKAIQQDCNPGQAKECLFWLPWSEAYFSLNPNANLPPGQKRMCEDLKELLRKKGLAPFLGFEHTWPRDVHPTDEGLWQTWSNREYIFCPKGK